MAKAEAQPQPAPPAPEQPAEQRGLGCLVRLVWMFVGNLVLAICIGGILEHRGGFFSPAADVVYWLMVATMAALRYVDVTRLHGLTATGQPATLASWRRYLWLLLGIAGALWVTVHLIAWSRR